MFHFRKSKRKKSNSEQTLPTKSYETELKCEAIKGHKKGTKKEKYCGKSPMADLTKQNELNPPLCLKSVSLLDLANCYKSEECTCYILRPEPVLPGSPPVERRVLFGGGHEYTIFISRLGNNVFRLLAKKKETDELFLNIALNDAKYSICSDTWHEIESSESGRKRVIVLDFLVRNKAQLASFQKFFDCLLNFLHRKKTLSQVKIFYPPGYNYENLLSQNYGKEGIGSGGMFNQEFQVGQNSNQSKMSPEDINSLTTQLSRVIEIGAVTEAKTLAGTLAEQKVKVKIEVIQPDQVIEPEEPEISVKVYVEDKESSGASMVINVRPSITVGMLKKKIQTDYEFPEVIQKWIIGSVIPKDTDLLKSCGVNGPGCSIFLYLLSGRSVGLTKEAFLQQQATNGDTPMQSNATPDDNNVYISMNGSNREMSTDTHVEENVPIYHPTLEPPEHRIECHLGRRNPPPLPSKPPPKLTAVSPPQVPQRNPVRTMDRLNIQPSDVALTTLLDSPQRATTQGWTCTQCTFINLPTRPGCEMCTTSRPVDYKMPEDLTIPEEEQARLNREQQLDVQAQTVGVGDQRERQDARANQGRDLLTQEYLSQILSEVDRIFPNQNPSRSPVMESVPTEHSESDDDNTDNDHNAETNRMYFD